MTVEAATYIASLNSSYPDGADPKSEGDNHLRLIKSVLLSTLPNLDGAVNATDTEINYVVGVTSAVQTQLNAKAPLASPTLTGTPVAPTAAGSDNSTQIATTAMVQSAIAGVNAASGALAVSVDATNAIALSVGQKVACTYAGTVTYTLPAGPTIGQRVGMIIANGRADTVVARNGSNIMGLAANMTIDAANASLEFVYLDASNGWRMY